MKYRKLNIGDAYTVVEQIETIEGLDYHLIPNHHKFISDFYGEQHQYNKLDELSQAAFASAETLHPWRSVHFDFLPNLMPSDLCEYVINSDKNDPGALNNPEVISRLLKLLIAQGLGQKIKGYFKSNFALLWYSHLKTTQSVENRAYSSFWHCDKGPDKHLKLLVYLNDTEEHGGNTVFLDEKSTLSLKECGYIFGNLHSRKDELKPLASKYNLALNEFSVEHIKAGDALLFAPSQLAHKGIIPSKKMRHVLQFCFIQSPFDWEFTFNNVWKPKPFTVEFENAAQLIIKYAQNIKATDSTSAFIPAGTSISSPEQLLWFLENIYSDKSYVQLLYERLIELDLTLSEITNVELLLTILKNSAEQSIDWTSKGAKEDITNYQELMRFCDAVKETKGVYGSEAFWPMPDHASQPASKFQQFPYVKQHKIMDRHTPIGSAGSCFAFEIAKELQLHGYNYVVTERNDHPESGIIVDGYRPGDKYAKFCANYGILFNTPSFKQLAERAFGELNCRKVLFQQRDHTWVDPYRENVSFLTQEAYLQDYDRHLYATRAALSEVEIFIVTLGLNECWTFRDGTVLSRNPRENMYPFVERKVLSVKENVDNIQRFYDLVKKHNPNFKLIISVSPVPMLATFQSQSKHVIEANTHSKAVLRVAAEELVNRNDDMYYLPSYELVTECIEDAWEIDTRHVKRSTVLKVIDMFNEMFVKE